MTSKFFIVCAASVLAALVLTACGRNENGNASGTVKNTGTAASPGGISAVSSGGGESGHAPAGKPGKPVIDPDFAAIRFDSAGPKNEQETPKVEVQQDHIHEMTKDAAESAAAIRTTRRSDWQLQSKVPAGSVADMLQKALPSKDTRTVWAPLEFSASITPVRLPDAKLSQDKTLFVFVETTGEAQGPFGSRLVIMNAGNWNIVQIIEMPERFITRVLWLPGKPVVAALCAKQQQMKQLSGIALIDLAAGKEILFRRIPEDAGRTMFTADSRGHILLSHPEKPAVLVLDANTLEDVKQLKVAGPDSLAALSPDGKRIAFANAKNCKHIEIFKTADLQPLSTVPIPENFPLHQFFFLQASNGFFLCGDPATGRESVIIMAGRPRTLDGWASGIGAVSGDGSTIYNILRNENKICVVDAKSGSMIRTYETNRAEPRLTSPGPGAITMFELLPAIHAMAILDTQGNFFLISTEKGKNKHAERAIIFQRRK